MWCCWFLLLQMEQSAQFKTQLMADQEKLHWLSSHVKDLKMQLSQTQQGMNACFSPTNTKQILQAFLWCLFSIGSSSFA